MQDFIIHFLRDIVPCGVFTTFLLKLVNDLTSKDN